MKTTLTTTLKPKTFRWMGGLLAASTLPLLCLDAYAEVKPHALFSDDMVLQREKSVPVWGTANPNEKVAVTIAGQTKTTQADTEGNWRVNLDAMPVGTNLTLAIKGDNEIALKNVAIGDVYICSGQSNMNWSVRASNNAEAEIAAANYPNIRLFSVPSKVAGTPQKTFRSDTRWQVCSPQTVAGFSAVGYYFGRELNQRLNIPIGLIHSSWGGTFAQAWTSRSTLLKRDDLREQTLATEKAFAGLPEGPVNQLQEQWWQTNDAGTREKWNVAEYNDTTWRAMNLPTAWESAGLPDFDGLVWFRKTVEIPAAWEGKDLTLFLGNIDDRDTTFWNGVQVGATNRQNQPRRYKIPSAQVKAGRATITIRVLDTGGNGGVRGGEALRLEVAGDATQKIDLAGEWKYQSSTALSALPPQPVDVLNNPNQPSVLFNGMIAPLVPYAVRGAIWYQGESNAGNAKQYQTLFPDLIKDWREVWNAKQDGSEFGFYFVQLANFMARSAEPVQSGWAELRDAQTGTLKVVPRTGMATILDIGEEKDIHPRNKQDVGKRLALAVLATEYGQKIESSGPMFKALKASGKEVRIDFAHANGLKSTDAAAPRTFAVQDETGKWHHASARIDGESVVVWNDEVLAPKAVAYAWANNPDVNLVNAAGLPAVPFRVEVK